MIRNPWNSHRFMCTRSARVKFFAPLSALYLGFYLIVTTVAAELPEPIFNVSPPQRGQVIVEHVYEYKVLRYSPPVRIKLIKERKQTSYETPEETVIAHFSSMFAKDYDWFLEGWTKEAQRKMEAQDKASKRSPDFWVKTWDKVLKQRQVQFVTRIETGNYVIIAYKLVATSGSQPDFESTVVVKQVPDGRWLKTYELAADPVPLYWQKPDSRVRKRIR